ncbi:hypothetical protein HETIRDRAFT_103727 [Heterobasidion irregulare TC 32-1]|uniref:Uncharacterized protein n=1 Tax=Heterobasidion irregulare (strain TC 32-1) TaxID=747525 RepID=W4K8R3_HETIT|nr:uncharacterized protein HETIRDRAFT_103727 [Heterobasidion irregulare TC 32-1]ETW81451.1 hypothetical protein HETIRDRAFT_103727 [Heterobasidion irregulare TC 32-1]
MGAIHCRQEEQQIMRIDDYPGNTEVWPSEKEEEEPDDTNRNPHARKRAGSKTAMRFTRGRINPTGEGRTS